MELIWLVIGAIFLLGALWAGNAAINRPGGFVDKDADGEPDESPAEKAEARQAFEEEQRRRHPEDI